MSGEQVKEPIICARMGLKNRSLAITDCHHSASLVMPIADPWDKFFYPTLTLIIDFYNLYGVASGSELMPCNKIDKPLVVYIFSGNVMTSITTLRT